jgi:hypothetical protein
MAARRAVFVSCSAFPDGFERKASVIFSPPSSGVFLKGEKTKGTKVATLCAAKKESPTKRTRVFL